MTYPLLYVKETVEAPFTGFAPTPDIVDELKAKFIASVRAQYPTNPIDEIEVLSSCLVTGQSFAMTLSVAVRVVNEDGQESNTTRDDQVGSVVNKEVDQSTRNSKKG